MPPAAVIPAGPTPGAGNGIRAVGPQWTSRRLVASADQDKESPGVAANGRRGVRHRVRHGIEAGKGKYAESPAEHLWRRLDAMDFINRGMLFAATLLLCLFPFLIIANALAGRSAASGLARHLGLNQQAAADVGALFTSSAATSSAVTGTAWVFFILGGIAAATAIQGLYEAAFELEGRGARDMLRRLIWLAVLVGGSVLAGWAGPALRSAGGPGPARGHRPGWRSPAFGGSRSGSCWRDGSPGGTCSRPPSPRPCSGWAWRQCSRSSSPGW